MTSYLSDKWHLQHHSGISIKDIDELPYYEFLEYRTLLADFLKRQAKEQEAQQNAQNVNQPKMKKPSMPQMRSPKKYK